MAQYTEDLSGVLPANRISDEKHTLTKYNSDNFYYILPSYAPYYSGNLIVKHVNGSVKTTLVEDVDYVRVNEFASLTRHGAPIFNGGISIINNAIHGDVEVTYNTIGGDLVGDRIAILQKIATELLFPSRVHWDQITDKPATFPPNHHIVQMENIAGMNALIDSMDKLVGAIGAPTNSVSRSELTVSINAVKAQMALWESKILGSSAPIGTVCMYPITAIAAPDNYYNCNGAMLLTADYTELYSKLGKTFNDGTEPADSFRLPDYRGMFLRCVDSVHTAPLNMIQQGTIMAMGKGNNINQLVRKDDTDLSISEKYNGDFLSTIEILANSTDPRVASIDTTANAPWPTSTTNSNELLQVRPTNMAINYLIRVE